ncbi:uncharacterized protein DS421_1g04770 [Arachis hypogaea]|nr:uncharacterized protein DS421_1g04770 [Arachis hypogaea]
MIAVTLNCWIRSSSPHLETSICSIVDRRSLIGRVKFSWDYREASFGPLSSRRHCTMEQSEGLNVVEAEVRSVDNLIYGPIMSPKPWQMYAPEIGFSWGIVPSWWFRSDDKFHVAMFMSQVSVIVMSELFQPNGFAERSYEMSSPCATGVGEDEMTNDTIPIEETDAMDLSERDTEIEVEESTMIVDGIGSFDTIDFVALTAKDILTIEFINLQASYNYYNEYGRIKGFSVMRSKKGRRTKHGSNGEIIW